MPGHTTITMDYGGKVSGGAAYTYQSEIGPSGAVDFDLTDDQEYRTVTIAIAPAEQRRLNPKNAKSEKDAFSIHGGIVQEVYEAFEWYKAGKTYSDRRK